AVVRVATELTPAQRQRLVRALSAAHGRGIHLNVVLDPEVVGGVSVQIGDELIDGTASSRLAEGRRKVAGWCEADVGPRRSRQGQTRIGAGQTQADTGLVRADRRGTPRRVRTATIYLGTEWGRWRS